MNVKEIVKQELEEIGRDGLCTDECGCLLDHLMPCDSYSGDCVPGYKVPCDCDGDWGCNLMHGGDNWHISRTKPENRKDKP